MLGLRLHQRRLLQLALFLMDLASLTFWFWLAFWLRFDRHFVDFVQTETFFAICCSVVASNYIFNQYEPLHWQVKLDKPIRVLIANAVALLLVLIGLYILGVEERGGLVGRGVLFGSFLGFTLTSFLYRRALRKRLKSQEKKLRWLVIASENVFLQLEKDLRKNAIQAQLQWFEPSLERLKELDEHLDLSWSSVVIERQLPTPYLDRIMMLRFRGQAVMSVQELYESTWSKVPIFTLDSNWFSLTSGFNLFAGRINAKLKRLGDLVMASSLFVLVSPVMMLLVPLIRLESRGPAIYSQLRVGEGGRVFTIYKFRSMVQDAEKSGVQWAKKNDSRITRLGRFIRATRLDELPQLVNILRGDMSFIGPRPERPEFVERLKAEIPFYELRHLVKPGLTGWAQVLYPYGSSVEDSIEKLQYELYYIKNYSLYLDVKIVLKTVSVILFGKGR